MGFLKNALGKVLSVEIVGLLTLCLFGVLLGGLLFVDSEYVIRNELPITEGRTPVTSDGHSILQSSHLTMQRVLRWTRSVIADVANEMTWAVGRSVEKSWIQETTLLNLRIRSTLSGELRAATRAVGGTHIGGLGHLTEDEFLVVTRNGTVLVYDVDNLTVIRRIQVQGITANADPGTGIRDVELISISDSTARYIATHAITDTKPFDCTRIELIAFSVPLAGGSDDEQSISTPQSLWADQECVSRSVAINAILSGRLFFDVPDRLYLAVGDVAAEHPDNSLFGTLAEFKVRGNSLETPDQMTHMEFAEEMKEKYPEYATLADDEVVTMMLDKHPFYRSWVRNDELETIQAKIVSKGFRNPAGLAVAGGRIYVANQGPQGGDTINIVAPGKDFGWPSVSYGTEYSEYRLSEYSSSGNNSLGEFDTPTYVWLPTPAVSALGVNQTTSLDSWFNETGTGDLLVASLKGRRLYRCRISAATGEVVYCESIYIGERLRDVVSTRKALILLADSGYLYHITRH